MFIDEGGNFDFSPKGTKFFTLTCLTETRPFPSYDKLRKLKYDLLEDGINIESFHASPDKQIVRNKVFEVIQENADHIVADTIIVQKNKTNPALYPEEKFYCKIFEILMKWVLSKRVTQRNLGKLIIFTDSIPVKKKKRAIEKGIKKTLASMVKGGLEYRIYHHQSKSNLNLQVVDYINWAIYRKWEEGDVRSYDLVRNIIDGELDVFQRGSITYY